MDDFSVTIDYKNKNLEQISEKTYSLQEYVEMLKLEIMRVIMDVEDVFYSMYGQKKEWSKEVTASFQKIRHKLLDNANAIERLPQKLKMYNIPCISRNFRDILLEKLK